MPLQAADRTYGDWVRPLLSRRRRLARRVGYRVAAILGLREAVTVADLTAFVPTCLLPEDLDLEWVERTEVGRDDA